MDLKAMKQTMIQLGYRKALVILCLLFSYRESHAQILCNAVDDSGAAQYRGGCLNNLAHGTGAYRDKVGTYFGHFKDGERNGYGTVVAKTYVAEGSFKDGLADGFMVFMYLDGDILESGVKRGKKEGYAKLTDLDGSTVVGRYVADHIHGRVVVTYPNGNFKVLDYENGKKIAEVWDSAANAGSDPKARDSLVDFEKLKPVAGAMLRPKKRPGSK